MKAMLRMANAGSHDSLPPARALLVAYLAQLVAPLVMVVDLASYWRTAPVVGHFEEALFGASVAWIALAVAMLCWARDRSRFLARAARPLLVFYGCCLALALFEIAAALAPAREPTWYPPGHKYVLRSDPKLKPGIAPSATFTVNEVGLRGPAMPAPGTYKIATVGGSTTESADLDDTEEWPHLVMEDLNRAQPATPAWVANAGVNGNNAVHHLALLQGLPILRRMDALVFLVGGNDLDRTLVAEGAPTQAMLEYQAQYLLSFPNRPLFKRLAVVRLLHRAMIEIETRNRSEIEINWFVEKLRVRASAPRVPLPDLSVGLAEYAMRIHSLISACRERQLRCVFLTQPTVWRPDLSPDDDKRLWAGCVGPSGAIHGCVSAGDLARAMDAYNRKLLDVCSEQKVECYDLAAAIPKSWTAFYDDMHFTRAGSKLVAEFVSSKLLAAPPFTHPLAGKDSVP